MQYLILKSLQMDKSGFLVFNFILSENKRTYARIAVTKESPSR